MRRKPTSVAGNKHQQRTEATMRDLLAAAETVFVRDGYERAQIETIAAEAGRTRGAIYAHFKSKEDIFFALMETKAQGQLDLYVREVRDIPFEQKVATARHLFLHTMKEENWLILLLEFKLFALRNKASHDRIRNLTEMLYDDISRDLLTTLGLSKAEKQLALTAFTVLRSLPSAMALERRFNPGTSSGSPLRQVLETVFEAMVNIGHHHDSAIVNHRDDLESGAQHRSDPFLYTLLSKNI